MSKISTENNFVYLFIALVTLFFSSSVMAYIQNQFVGNIIEILIFFILLISVRSLKSERSWRFSVYTMMFFLTLIFIANYFITALLFLDVIYFMDKLGVCFI